MPFLYSRLESTGEGIANGVIHRQQLLTGEGHRSDAHDRDESGDQAIFNGGDAGFVFNETGNEDFHRIAPDPKNKTKLRLLRVKPAVSKLRAI
jgi:hypothetical protein